MPRGTEGNLGLFPGPQHPRSDHQSPRLDHTAGSSLSLPARDRRQGGVSHPAWGPGLGSRGSVWKTGCVRSGGGRGWQKFASTPETNRQTLHQPVVPFCLSTRMGRGASSSRGPGITALDFLVPIIRSLSQR